MISESCEEEEKEEEDDKEEEEEEVGNVEQSGINV